MEPEKDNEGEIEGVEKQVALTLEVKERDDVNDEVKLKETEREYDIEDDVVPDRLLLADKVGVELNDGEKDADTESDGVAKPETVDEEETEGVPVVEKDSLLLDDTVREDEGVYETDPAIDAVLDTDGDCDGVKEGLIV